jgi:hypothetical protein
MLLDSLNVGLAMLKSIRGEDATEFKNCGRPDSDICSASQSDSHCEGIKNLSSYRALNTSVTSVVKFRSGFAQNIHSNTGTVVCLFKIGSGQRDGSFLHCSTFKLLDVFMQLIFSFSSSF